MSSVRFVAYIRAVIGKFTNEAQVETEITEAFRKMSPSSPQIHIQHPEIQCRVHPQEPESNHVLQNDFTVLSQTACLKTLLIVLVFRCICKIVKSYY